MHWWLKKDAFHSSLATAVVPPIEWVNAVAWQLTLDVWINPLSCKAVNSNYSSTNVTSLNCGLARTVVSKKKPSINKSVQVCPRRCALSSDKGRQKPYLDVLFFDFQRKGGLEAAQLPPAGPNLPLRVLRTVRLLTNVQSKYGQLQHQLLQSPYGAGMLHHLRFHLKKMEQQFIQAAYCLNPVLSRHLPCLSVKNPAIPSIPSIPTPHRQAAKRAVRPSSNASWARADSLWPSAKGRSSDLCPSCASKAQRFHKLRTQLVNVTPGCKVTTWTVAL